MSFTIYFISFVAKEHYLKTSGIGIFYLLSHSLIFELTPMQISEVSFTFLLFFIIYIYLQNFKNKDNVSAFLYVFLIASRLKTLEGTSSWSLDYNSKEIEPKVAVY